MLKSSIAVGETLAEWEEKGYRDGAFTWEMDKRGQANVAIKNGGLVSLENLLGSVAVKIETLSDDRLRVSIFNIANLTSGDYEKHFIPNYISPPLKSVQRTGNNEELQTEYSNVSQHFSFTLTKEEAVSILMHYNPK